MHGIGAAKRRLGHHIGQAVNHIGVVARPAIHLVIAAAAIQRVIPGPAKQRVIARTCGQQVIARVPGQHVINGIAGPVHRCRPRQRQVFKGCRCQNKGNGGQNGIDALPARFQNLVQARIHHKRVIAEPAGHAVIAGTAIQHVIAIACGNRVVASRTGQNIIAGIAHQNVGHPVAGAVDVQHARQRQVFHIGLQRQPDRRNHRIRAAAHTLQPDIARVIHIIRVVAQPADHAVGPDAAIQRIVAIAAIQRVIPGQCRQNVVRRIPGQGVVADIARAVDRRRPGQDQRFHIGRQRGGCRCLNGIRALGSQFGHDIGGAAHHVIVVASPPGHRVIAQPAVQYVIPDPAKQRIGARPAIERVIAVQPGQHIGRRVANDDVILRVAGGIDHAGAGQGNILKVQPQRVAARGLHQIDALTRQLGQDIAYRVNDIHIVAGAACQRVIAIAAIQRVIARVARHAVIAVPGIDQIVANTGQDRVIARIGINDVVPVTCINAIGQRGHAGHLIHPHNRRIDVAQTVDEVICCCAGYDGHSIAPVLGECQRFSIP